MSEEGWKAFLGSEGVGDWVVLHGGATAFFRVASLGDAARLAGAIAAVPGLEESSALLTLSDEGVTVRLTREGWQDVVAKMVGLGARGTEAELEQVTDYLATNFKGEAPKPINMNTASSVELESVAALLRKEAAAWIAYRNTKGGCKTLDDLKKVVGVPFKKIDERRDRLVCF